MDRFLACVSSGFIISNVKGWPSLFLDLLWGLNRLVHGKHLKQYQVYISSVQFSHSVMSNALQPHELQHARPPCLLPTPGVDSNSCQLSQKCHSSISSSVIPFSSCLQSSPASGSFQMSQFFTSGGQSIGVSASTSVLPGNIQDWFPPGWTGLILQSKGLSRVFFNTTVQKHQFGTQLLYCAYKLNKQGDNIQPWHTPFPIWNQSVSNIHRSYHSC